VSFGGHLQLATASLSILTTDRGLPVVSLLERPSHQRG
jgi:hypothetical protein